MGGTQFNSIQYFLSIMFDVTVHKKGLSPTWITKVMDYNPAKIFKLYGRKGAFEIGFDGDLVIFDPDKKWEITRESLLTKGSITAFEGVKGKGMAIYTIVRGKVVAENKQCNNILGYGQYITPVK